MSRLFPGIPATRAYCRRPRVADALVHPQTGNDMIVDEVRAGGRVLTVTMDGWGTFEIARHENGHWVRALRPCAACGEPTEARVLNYDPDGGWQPLCRGSHRG